MQHRYRRVPLCCCRRKSPGRPFSARVTIPTDGSAACAWRPDRHTTIRTRSCRATSAAIWARIGIVLSMVWAIMGSIWALKLAFRTRLPELRDLPDPDHRQSFWLSATFSDAVGRRSRAEACGGCHCGPRNYPPGVAACLRPGRPRPLDQTRLPTSNLAPALRLLWP